MTAPRQGRGAAEQSSSGTSLPDPDDQALRAAADTAYWRQYADRCQMCAIETAIIRLEHGHRVDPMWLAGQLRELRVWLITDSWIDHHG